MNWGGSLSPTPTIVLPLHIPTSVFCQKMSIRCSQICSFAGFSFVFHQYMRVLKEKKITFILDSSWHIKTSIYVHGYIIGDTMECCNGVCAHIKWVSKMVLKDMIPSQSGILYPYNIGPNNTLTLS